MYDTQPRPLKINSCVFLGIRPPQEPEDSWQGCIQWQSGWFYLITMHFWKVHDWGSWMRWGITGSWNAFLSTPSNFNRFGFASNLSGRWPPKGIWFRDNFPHLGVTKSYYVQWSWDGPLKARPFYNLEHVKNAFKTSSKRDNLYPSPACDCLKLWCQTLFWAALSSPPPTPKPLGSVSIINFKSETKRMDGHL